MDAVAADLFDLADSHIIALNIDNGSEFIH